MNEKTRQVKSVKHDDIEENSYDRMISNLETMTDIEQKEFVKVFWNAMSRQEQVVFTIDALKSFERQGTSDEFLSEVNNKIQDKQKKVMDSYLEYEIDLDKATEILNSLKEITITK